MILINKYIINNHNKICLRSASARNSELQRIDASSLIFQLMYNKLFNVDKRGEWSASLPSQNVPIGI